MTLSREQAPAPDWREIDDLLRAVVADGFTVLVCGDPRRPEVLVATYAWAHHVDLVVIKDAHDVTAARAPRTPGWDVFAVETVVWSYQGHARWALRALLDLVPPDHPGAPVATYPAPLGLHVAPEHRTPRTVRAPRPGRAGIRAARTRLAAG